jgi:hypothetical protein
MTYPTVARPGVTSELLFPLPRGKGAVVRNPQLLPSMAVQSRLVAFVMAQENRLGHALRGRVLRLSRGLIAENAGTKNANWVTNKCWTLGALLDGVIYTQPSCRKAVLSDLNGLLERARSDEAVAAHIKRVRDTVAGKCTDRSAAHVRRAVSAGLVYVAVQPTFFQLLGLCKVGFTTGPPRGRAARLGATGSPEPFLLVRLFQPIAEMTAQQTETLLMDCLRAGGYGYDVPGGGREWFRADLTVIDQLATACGAKRLLAPDEDVVDELRRVPSAALVEASTLGGALAGLRVSAPECLGEPMSGRAHAW